MKGDRNRATETGRPKQGGRKGTPLLYYGVYYASITCIVGACPCGRPCPLPLAPCGRPCAQYISLKDLLQEAQVREDQADRQNRGTDPQDRTVQGEAPGASSVCTSYRSA